ncbi:MAG: xanthine dehydrogenase accessory protein XdhC [Myxococcota bacterium]|jgi:xanthine dehydrogenase accessory factor
MTLYADMAALLEEGRPFVLATVIASHGSTPQKPGSKLVVLEGGELRGTVGGGAIEKQIVDAALALLADDTAQTRTLETHLTHDLGMCCGGKMTIFLEKHGAAPALVVFGAGHVAKEVAALAAHVGFRVSVVDERAEWLSAERFPSASRRLEPPEVVAKALPGGRDVYAVVATHDHPLDQACVEALLGKPLAWLGVIGSRRKAERFRQRLKAAGFSDDAVARFESPMGVPIGALTPREIAVSVVARLVEVRRKAAPR